MHAVVLRAFDKVRFVTVANKELLKVLVLDSRQDRRVVYLVAVQVKNW